MTNDSQRWKHVIENYIDERKNSRLIDLLKKKVPKIKDYDEKQCIKTQILYALNNSNSWIDVTKISDIDKRKNTGNNKADELSFIKKMCDDLFDLFPISSTEGAKIKNIYQTRYNSIVQLHKPSNWLNTYVTDAKGIFLATHVPKITHSSISPEATAFSIKKKNKEVRPEKYFLTTDSFHGIEYDFFRNTAAYDRTINLLKLSLGEKKLYHYIQDNDSTPFLEIADTEEDAKRWVEELCKIFSPKSWASHALQKQVYFPVNQDANSYHLLCIVPSSSIIHLMYNKFNERYQKMSTTFLDKDKKILPSKSKAVLRVTSSDDAHRNVSPLNVERKGKVCLLSSQPPVWKSQSKFHLKNKNIFDIKIIYYRTSESLFYLTEYLLRFEGINLSISAPEKKNWLKRWVDDIWKDIFSYADEIVFSSSPNWTKTEKHNLKLCYQFLLDPYCTDDDFQEKRETLKWQDEIAHDFSRWLTRSIGNEAKKNNKSFLSSGWHQSLWFDYASEALRIHENEIQKLSYDFSQEHV